MTRRGDRLSLRARLVAVLLLLLTVALVLSSAASMTVLSGELRDRVDKDLQEASRQEVLRALSGGAAPETAGQPSPYDITLTTSEGRRLSHWSSFSAPEQRPELRLSADLVQRLDGRPFTVGSVDGNGPRWRVVTSAFVVENRGARATLLAAVATPLDGVQETVGQMVRRLVLIGAAVLGACALLGLVAVTRAFRPLREVESVATAFGQGDTSRRVQNTTATTEVGRLGRSVNAMLDGIESTLAAREASEARMRRFVADASHELRTPVAAVRGFAELYRQGAVREPEDVTRSFRRIEDEATRMGGLVEDLLLLARLDEQRPLRREPVDLLVLAADAVHDIRALDPGRPVRLTGLGGDPVPRSAGTVGDDARLRQVLSNLVSNALRHTPAGSPLEVGVGVAGGWARWQVVDHGPGIQPQEAERIFERFYRSDGSRTRGAGGGSGLGLAIVDAISRAHGGAARVVPTPGGGATFEVALPLAELPGTSQV